MGLAQAVDQHQVLAHRMHGIGIAVLSAAAAVSDVLPESVNLEAVVVEHGMVVGPPWPGVKGDPHVICVIFQFAGIQVTG